MTVSSSRRRFLQTGAALGAGAALGWPEVASAQGDQKIRFACIGVGGKGSSDTADAAKHGVVVAICDVDEPTLAEAAKKYPDAKRYTDYRKMFEEMAGGMDAVTVSTPDHHHAPAASLALQLGKHCFCQKPLTHTIWEARRLGELAREKKVVTQMGNQGTAGAELRRNAAMIRKGVLGKVTEVHVWTNRPIWEQGGPRPAPAAVPSGVDWNIFLGPAPERPYAPGYHKFGWRGWWDFGTGALGDMACHTMNMPFMALDLRNPTSVVAESSGHNRDSYPKWSVIHFEFPANDWRGPVKFVWYDGGKKVSPDLLGAEPANGGALIIGEKGKLYSPGDYGGGSLIGVEPIEVEYVQSPGHFTEFAEAIKKGGQAMSNFPDYAGPLTETILLGNLAVWADGKKIEWDAATMDPKNAPEVRQIVKKEYRKGWSV